MNGQTSTVVTFGDEVLERMALAVEMVQARLKRATSALNQTRLRYAVIGGNAIAAWVSRIDPGAVRNTVDVDLLVCREDFPRVRQALEGAGFIHSFTYGVNLFIDGPTGNPREGIHVLFANEKVQEDYLFPTPDVTQTEPHQDHAILNLEQLVQMKLTSFRRKDQVHIQDLIEVGLLDATWLAKLPEQLRPRLQELLDDPHG